MLCEDLEGWDGEKGGPRERGYIHLWLIHITVKQKPIQHFKEVILQFKNNTIFFKSHLKKCLSELGLKYLDPSFCGPFGCSQAFWETNSLRTMQRVE